MNKISFLLIALVTIIVVAACKKDIEQPPQNVIPEGNIITVTDLMGMYAGTPIHFTDGDTNIYCVVTADETSGNLYKNVYVTDGNRGLNVRLVTSGGLYIGDSIRINLNGTILSEYNGMLQLDSVNVDQNVVKQATGVDITPATATIDDVIADPNLVGMLVKLNNVEFLNTDIGTTFADAINQMSANKTVVDCNGTQVLMRTSGYASFAGSTVPAGNGSIVAIVGKYNADIQLYLRDLSDINLPNSSCQPTIYLQKDFEDQNVTSGGWTVQMVTGAVNWTSNTQGALFGTAYGQISNWNGSSNELCESWLISPAMDLSGATSPMFSFENAYNYAGAPLEVYVSTNYDGVSDPSVQGTWTALSPTLSGGTWSWVNSGLIDLTTYMSPNTYVGFKYTGSSSNGSTWEIDNILVED